MIPIALVTAGAATVACLPDSTARFAAITATSIAALWAMPNRVRNSASIFSTYIHEICHGLVAVATGGMFRSFQVTRRGGVCYTAGGNRFAVLAAGYLGTMLVAGTIVCLSARHETSRFALITLGVLVAATAFSRTIDHFTKAVGLLGGLAFVVFGCLLGDSVVTSQLLNACGIALGWAGSVDLLHLFDLSVYSSNVKTDARQIEALNRSLRAPYIAIAFALIGLGFVFGGVAVGAVWAG